MHSFDDFIELLENNVNTSIRECVKRDKEKTLKEKEKNKEFESIKERNVIDSFLTRKEIKMLPQALDDNEQIKYVTSGSWRCPYCINGIYK